jgi:hypothetical protein
MSCVHCIELELQIAELREEVASTRARRLDQAFLFSEHFGISRHPAIVLATLYARGGDHVTSRLLDEALPAPSHGNVRPRNHISIYIFRLRGVLGKGSIVARYRDGWALTPAGRLLCDEALEARARAA